MQTITVPLTSVFGNEKATQRAWDLLISHLTSEQRSSLETNKYFEVVGSQTGTIYRIKRRDSGARNVISYQNGQAHLAYDAAPVAVINMDGLEYRQSLPQGDVMLAQKLCLENDEDSFLSRACKVDVAMMELHLHIDRMMMQHDISFTNIARQIAEQDARQERSMMRRIWRTLRSL